MMKKKLFVIFAAMMLAVAFMPAVATAEFTQLWAEPSYNTGTLMRVEMWVTGGTFSGPFTEIPSGWSSAAYSNVAYMTGPGIIGGLNSTGNFNVHFTSEVPLTVYAYDFSGPRSSASVFDAYTAVYSGSGGFGGWSWSNGAPPLPSTVPIPAAVWLLGTGLVGLFGIRRRFTS